MQPLSVSSEPIDAPSGVRVALTGELDIGTAPTAEQEIQRAEGENPGRLVLDLSNLTFMDSTGLRLVVAADVRARESGRHIQVVRGPEAVQRVFELTGVDQRLEFVDGVSAV